MYYLTSFIFNVLIKNGLIFKVTDLETVVRRFVQQSKGRKESLTPPVKMTRSVGLQINNPGTPALSSSSSSSSSLSTSSTSSTSSASAQVGYLLHYRASVAVTRLNCWLIKTEIIEFVLFVAVSRIESEKNDSGDIGGHDCREQIDNNIDAGPRQDPDIDVDDGTEDVLVAQPAAGQGAHTSLCNDAKTGHRLLRTSAGLAALPLGAQENGRFARNVQNRHLRPVRRRFTTCRYRYAIHHFTAYVQV